MLKSNKNQKDLLSSFYQNVWFAMFVKRPCRSLTRSLRESCLDLIIDGFVSSCDVADWDTVLWGGVVEKGEHDVVVVAFHNGGASCLIVSKHVTKEVLEHGSIEEAVVVSISYAESLAHLSQSFFCGSGLLSVKGCFLVVGEGVDPSNSGGYDFFQMVGHGKFFDYFFWL